MRVRTTRHSSPRHKPTTAFAALPTDFLADQIRQSARLDFREQSYALPDLGAELITNGTFDTTVSGWTAMLGTATWVAGAAEISTTNSNGRIEQLQTVVTGKLYRVAATFTNGSNCRIGVFRGAAGNYAQLIVGATTTGNFTQVVYFVATGPDILIQLSSQSATATFSVDNVSLKEVLVETLSDVATLTDFTLSVNGGTGTATETPSGTLTLAGDGTNFGSADKQLTGLTVGAIYKLTFFNVGATISAKIGTSTNSSDTVSNSAVASGSQGTFYFSPTQTSHWLRFQRGVAGNTVVSDVSIARVSSGTSRPATSDEVFSAFTCASTGSTRTYVGGDRLLKKDIATNKPRFDYTSGFSRLLLEEESTNLFTYSEDTSNAVYSRTSMNITLNDIAAPDGSLTAHRLTETAGSAIFSRAAATITTGVPHTVSVFMKRFGSLTWGRFLVGNNSTASNGAEVWVNLTTGVRGTMAPRGTGWTIVGNPEVKAVADNWYRVSITVTSSTDTTCAVLFATASSDLSTTRTVGSYYVWGLQLEAKSFATSYIPTVASTVTRSAESFKLPPILEAVLQRPAASVAVRYGHTGSVGVLLGNDTGAHLLSYAAGNTARAKTSAGTIVTSTFAAGSHITAGAAMGFDTAGRTVSGNRGTPTIDTSAPSVRTNSYLGRDGGTEFGSGFYDELLLWPHRAAGASLQTLATPYPRFASTAVPTWVKVANGITAKFDLDFENNRYWINGKEYLSLVEVYADGAIQTDDTVTRVIRLATPLVGPTFFQLDSSTKIGANNVVTTGRTFWSAWDSATGADDGSVATPQNGYTVGTFWDGGNGHNIYFSLRAGNVDYTAGNSWSIYRMNTTRQRSVFRNDLNLHSLTANNVAPQTDTTAGIALNIDRFILGNSRARTVPLNLYGEAIHRFVGWEGTISNAQLQALST